ncbi:MAG: FtsX-like permease family protein [Rubrivivax sp.]|nr:FtsX-like permease family protein [Rubrivivax sp.]
MAGLWPLVLSEWRHQPWRHLTALLAVALGVALAWSVHLINHSALSEFASAVRSANGQPDAVLRAGRQGLDEALIDRVAALPAVAQVSAVAEVDTYALDSAGKRVALRVMGVDALAVAWLAPDLMPRPIASADRLATLDPNRAFANAAAREALALRDDEPLRLQAGTGFIRPRLAGHVAAGGPPLLVMDIAAVQSAFGLAGRVSRVDIRWAAGGGPAALAGLLPEGVRLADVDENQQRVSNLSRAYRVNLSVLALVALFVGSFLVYSVVSLSVAQRTPQLALLGVLGLTARDRRRLILGENAVLGTLGTLLGLALGTGAAMLALRLLSGDLGGGYFGAAGSSPPPLRVPWPALALFGALGVAAALVGAWVPATQAQGLQPAQALKGLGSLQAPQRAPWLGLALCGAGALLALAPPLGGLPLAAYASVAAWLSGGVALVPACVNALLRLAPAPRSALVLLALERARFQRQTSTAVVAGVVASLALSVALTVMVSSFREGVAQWLDRVLPADLYARTAQTSALAEQAWLTPEFSQRVAALPGVRQVQVARSRALSLAPGRPTVTLFARELADPQQDLPLIEAPLPPRLGELGAYVSEAMVSLYGARQGTLLSLPVGDQILSVRVLGVWRDYARQFGTVAIELQAYRRLTGDLRINDLAIWLQPGAAVGDVKQALRQAVPDPALIEFATPAELRRISLAIFDRSFAVTTYLQIVAIGIGLVGIAATLSAQVLARRKEFGLLAHLGLTRGEVMRLVAGEAAAWLAAGVLVGLALGAIISAVLVHVVNPQSFHWTMDMVWPWLRLGGLAAAVLAAGVLTAAWSARHAASRAAVLAVKEDW